MTEKQAQHLLAYLGFYTLEADGLWGPGSRSAMEAFEARVGLPVTGLPGEAAGQALKRAVQDGLPGEDFWEEIEFFTREEFKCKCGLTHAPYCGGFPAEPKQANSQHMAGEAADVTVPGLPAEALLAAIRSRPGVRYAYAINETNVHFDIPKGG